MSLPTLPALMGLPDPRSEAFAGALRARLVANGLLDDLSARRAERAAQQSNERFDVALSRLGLVSDAAIARVLSDELAIPLVSEGNWPDTRLFAEDVPDLFLQTNRILPLRDSNPVVDVAIADPFNGDALSALAFQIERPVRMLIAPAADIERAIERLLGRKSSNGAVSDLAVAAPDDDTGTEDVRRLEDLASEAPVIRLVHDIIVRAVESRASDIHIEPRDDCVSVRYRIDGTLTTAETLPVGVRAALSSRIKIMARLNIAERRLPQDGRIRVAVRGREIDLRVSTMPTMCGESVVLRILDRGSLALDFEALGFAGPELAGFKTLLDEPNGIILVTGPTGSGKSTTLYTALSALNHPGRKLFTVEDPIEYQLKGVNQIAVNPKIGLTFASALRSILRQDPDIIMVGEIRDLETAEIAIRASLTGHLVLSTVHTNSAAATVTRLLDMGVEDYLLASSLKGVLAQRLVRCVCPSCATPADASGTDIRRLVALTGDKDVDPPHNGIRAPRGCPACQNTGYRGRTAIYELLPITPDVRDCISAGATEHSIEYAGIGSGMKTLLQNGAAKVLNGETTLEEVLRVTRCEDAALPV